MGRRPSAWRCDGAGRVVLVAVVVAVAAIVAVPSRAGACTLVPEDAPPEAPARVGPSDIVAVVVPRGVPEEVSGFQTVNGNDEIWTVDVVDVQYGPASLTTLEVIDPDSSCDGGSISTAGIEKRLLLRDGGGGLWMNAGPRFGPLPSAPWREPADPPGSSGDGLGGVPLPVIGVALTVLAAAGATGWVLRGRRRRVRPA